MPQPNELWWSVVPGPSQLVEQLTAHLVRFESALIPNHLHGIWLAQIRTVFSHIEETKFAIVQQHRNAIAALLHTTDDFGIAIEQMEDIELRHLMHAVNHNIISLPERTCAVINALYNSRNQLAHHRILPYSELKQLHQQLL